MSCGNSRSSKCNPCGPSEAAMNAIAEKAAYYARMAQYASDGFSQVYLGAKDTAPTTDNNGNPLVEGALYFNTVTELLYAWDGAAWASAIVGINTATTDTAQTITGQKTFTQSIIASGGVTGNVTGDVSGNAGTATTLQTARTIGISGSVTGTATSFNGSANITIPTTITTGATITSPNLAGTATGSLTTKVVQGVTDGTNALAGYIGEVIQGTSALTAIATNTIANGASITLTPGDWEVYGNATFNFSAVQTQTGSGDLIGASISTTSLTLVDKQRQVLLVPALTISGGVTQSPAYAFVTPRVRFNVTVNTLVYIVVQSPAITSGTMDFSSIITANRVR